MRALRRPKKIKHSKPRERERERALFAIIINSDHNIILDVLGRTGSYIKPIDCRDLVSLHINIYRLVTTRYYTDRITVLYLYLSNGKRHSKQEKKKTKTPQKKGEKKQTNTQTQLENCLVMIIFPSIHSRNGIVWFSKQIKRSESSSSYYRARSLHSAIANEGTARAKTTAARFVRETKRVREREREMLQVP